MFDFDKDDKTLFVKYDRFFEDANFKNRSKQGLDSAERNIITLPIIEGELHNPSSWGRNSIRFKREYNNQTKYVDRVSGVNSPLIGYSYKFSNDFILNLFTNRRSVSTWNDNILYEETLNYSHLLDTNFSNIEGYFKIEDEMFYNYIKVIKNFDSLLLDLEESLNTINKNLKFSLHKNTIPTLVTYNNKKYLTYLVKTLITNPKNREDKLTNYEFEKQLQLFFNQERNNLNDVMIVSTFSSNLNILNENKVKEIIEENKYNYSKKFSLSSRLDKGMFFSRLLLTRATIITKYASINSNVLLRDEDDSKEYRNMKHFGITIEVDEFANNLNDIFNPYTDLSNYFKDINE